MAVEASLRWSVAIFETATASGKVLDFSQPARRYLHAKSLPFIGLTITLGQCTFLPTPPRYDEIYRYIAVCRVMPPYAGRRSPYGTSLVHSPHHDGSGHRNMAGGRRCLGGTPRHASRAVAASLPRKASSRAAAWSGPRPGSGRAPARRLERRRSRARTGPATRPRERTAPSPACRRAGPSPRHPARRTAGAPTSTRRSGSGWTATAAARWSRQERTPTASAPRRTTTAGTRCTPPPRCTSATPSGPVTTSARR